MSRSTTTQSLRHLISRFNRAQMDRFDAATDPADIDRYQRSVRRVLNFIAVIVGLILLAVCLVIVLKGF